MKNKGKRNTDKNIVNYTQKNKDKKVNLTEEEIKLLEDLTFLKNYHKSKRNEDKNTVNFHTSKNKSKSETRKKLISLITAYLKRQDSIPLDEVELNISEETRKRLSDTSFLSKLDKKGGDNENVE